jgi:hypothetical protein
MAEHYIVSGRQDQLSAAESALRVFWPVAQAWAAAGGKRTQTGGALRDSDLQCALSSESEWDGVRLCTSLRYLGGWPVDMALAALLHTASCEFRALVEAEKARRVEQAAEVGRRALAKK